MAETQEPQSYFTTWTSNLANRWQDYRYNRHITIYFNFRLILKPSSLLEEWVWRKEKAKIHLNKLFKVLGLLES